MKNAKPRAVWQELPNHFKEDVVGLLDFRSSRKLKQCSRSDRNLVESSPLNLKIIELSVKAANNNVEIIVTDKTFQTDKLVVKGYTKAVPLFIDLLKHPMSRTEVFELSKDRKAQNETMTRTILKIVKTCEKNNSLMLKVENFWMLCRSEVRKSIELIKILDPNVLRRLELQNELTELRKLVETEQFKNLKEISINSGQSSEILNYLLDGRNHIEKFNVTLTNVTATDIWRVVQSFRSRKLPRFSNFAIYKPSLPPILKNEIFDLFDVSVQNEKFNSDASLHFQSFPTILSSEGLFLLMRISEMSVVGVICHKNSLKEDYEAAI